MSQNSKPDNCSDLNLGGAGQSPSKNKHTAATLTTSRSGLCRRQRPHGSAPCPTASQVKARGKNLGKPCHNLGPIRVHSSSGINRQVVQRAIQRDKDRFLLLARSESGYSQGPSTERLGNSPPCSAKAAISKPGCGLQRTATPQFGTG